MWMHLSSGASWGALHGVAILKGMQVSFILLCNDKGLENLRKSSKVATPLGPRREALFEP